MNFMVKYIDLENDCFLNWLTCDATPYHQTSRPPVPAGKLCQLPRLLPVKELPEGFKMLVLKYICKKVVPDVNKGGWKWNVSSSATCPYGQVPIALYCQVSSVKCPLPSSVKCPYSQVSNSLYCQVSNALTVKCQMPFTVKCQMPLQSSVKCPYSQVSNVLTVKC